MPNFELTEQGGYGQVRQCQLETLRNLCEIVQIPNPKFLEIGSWTGISTSVLAKYAKEKDGVVYAVDWFKGTPHTSLTNLAEATPILPIFTQNMAELGLSGNIKVKVMLSEEAVAEFPDNSLDFIFIDGDHRYAEVKKDLIMWYPKLKPGGVFCGHDCECRPSDIHWEIDEHLEEDWYNDVHPGVVKAVHEHFPECNIETDIWWVIK